MDRQLAAALKDLGLTDTDAAIYVALLEHCGDGPVTAYKLAQDLGRDPANLTKALAAMVKRGAAVASGKRPRVYAPTPPREFIGGLVSHLQARQEQAVALLEQIGKPADAGHPHPLETRDDALAAARRLLAEAERTVLISAAPEWRAQLAAELARAADPQGAVVLARSTATGAVPGPWLRLAVDGRAALVALGRADGDALVHGHWSYNPAEAYLLHHDLGHAAVLEDVLELLHTGTAADTVRRRAEDQWALIARQVPWQKRWRELDLAPYTVVAPEAAEDLDPGAVAAAMAEVAAEFTPGLPGRELAAAAGEGAGGESGEDTDDDGGPLRFIFRRKRPG
ncbi:MAG: helix-turn-helix domain-containing protein [Candidatus Krumholzibacteriia bacterium]